MMRTQLSPQFPIVLAMISEVKHLDSKCGLLYILKSVYCGAVGPARVSHSL